MADIEKAKQLYFEFGTSKYQMMREDVLDEYRSYNISAAQEEVWLTELLEQEIGKFDINNNRSFFPLWFIIETNSSTAYLEKLVVLINANLSSATNQFYIVLLGEIVFKLLFNCSKSKKGLSEATVTGCINTIESIINKARQLSLPVHFSIPDFSIMGEGLTQQQYVLRRISRLEQEVQTTPIIK